jgi:hypothetical protein
VKDEGDCKNNLRNIHVDIEFHIERGVHICWGPFFVVFGAVATRACGFGFLENRFGACIVGVPCSVLPEQDAQLTCAEKER